MKIALYGGSFNPPHLGHQEAAKTAAEELRPDMLLIMPDNIPPHKDMAEGSPDARQRMELCELAFEDIPGAVVSDMEISREGRSYTADTVSRLREQYGDDELFLIVGTDMLASFEQWYRFEYLLKSCTLAALSRAEDDVDEIRAKAKYLEEKYHARVRILPHAPVEVSSTEIREGLRLRRGCNALDDRVYSCIIKNGYYEALPELSWLREKAYAYLAPKRVAHVAGCESEAVLLAKRWGEDEEAAATAGILHDVTKKLSYDEQLILCEKYGIICDKAELSAPKLLHAKTGAALARAEFGVSEAIYEAIRWHTTGKKDMTLLEKIIYLADYIEPNRDFEGLDKLRELAYSDIDGAMALGLEMSLEDIRSRGDEPYKDTVEAYEWYAGRR